MEAANMTEAEKELRNKEKAKKGGLTKEQREELAAYELERKKIRDERVANLSKKLVERNDWGLGSLFLAVLSVTLVFGVVYGLAAAFGH